MKSEDENMSLSNIQKHLFEIRSDADYRALQQKIIPNIDPELVIGIRTPVIREYAKELRSQAVTKLSSKGSLITISRSTCST